MICIFQGSSKEQAVDLLPWFSLADVVGRAFLPIACDRGFIKRTHMITVAYWLCGIQLETFDLFRE